MEDAMMRRFLAFGLVFGMLLAGAVVPATAQDTLKIGAPQPMTGPDAPFGDKFKKAYGMAVEEINAKGGVNGKKIEVIIDDHQAKNAMAATVVYDNSVFGKTISNSAMTFLKSKNVPIVNDEAYPVNSLDFKPVMTKVKSNNPDYLLLVAVATTDAILLTRHAKEIGVAPRAFVGFGGGFGVEDFAKELGPQSQNVFSSAAWSGNPNDPAVREFYKKFHDKYGIWPKEHEVEGYAIVYVIADAMRRAQLTGNVDADREAIRQALLKTDMTTVFGKLKFGNWAGPLGDPYTNQNIYS